MFTFTCRPLFSQKRRAQVTECVVIVTTDLMLLESQWASYCQNRQERGFVAQCPFLQQLFLGVFLFFFGVVFFNPQGCQLLRKTAWLSGPVTSVNIYFPSKQILSHLRLFVRLRVLSVSCLVLVLDCFVWFCMVWWGLVWFNSVFCYPLRSGLILSRLAVFCLILFCLVRCDLTYVIPVQGAADAKIKAPSHRT